jgi:hypothetical protein
MFLWNSMASAQIISLASVANGATNYIEYFSDAFTRINIHPGTYGFASSTNPADPRTTIPTVTYNPNADFFPNNENFQLGHLTYDSAGLTGVGTEIRPVTGLSLDLFPNIPRFSYTTSASNISGAVTFTNGLLTSINVSSDVSITYAATQPGLYSFLANQTLTEPGGFQINGNQLSLFIDDEFPSSNPMFPWRAQFDVFGTVNAVVPEPSSLLLLSVGPVVVFIRRRRHP